MKLLDMTISQIISQKGTQIPDNIFLREFKSGYDVTYKELDTITDKISSGLIALGLKKEDKIGILGGNSTKWVEVLLAAAKIGIIAVPINVNYYQEEISKIWEMADLKMIFTDLEFREKPINEIIESILKSKNKLSHTYAVFMDENAHGNEYYLSWNEFIHKGSDVPHTLVTQYENAVVSQDIYTLQFTSGTTSEPKGVLLKQNAVINSCRYTVDAMELDSTDSMCIPVPLFTTFGTVVAVLTSLVAGATLVTIDYYSPLKMLSAMEKYKCTVMMGVPTMYINMIHLEDFEKYDVSPLKKALTAGAMCSKKLMHEIKDKFELDYMTGMYGMTEMSCGCTISRVGSDENKQMTTVGRSFANMEIRVVDSNKQEVPVGTEGEIVTRGYHLMKGYYKNEKASREVIDDNGWLHSGDIGVVDEDGYYKIVGRIKNIIIKGGFNIAPEEIEEKLKENDDIIDAQVIGIADKVYGEELVAFMQTKKKVDLEKLKNGLIGKIARYKIPKYYFFVEEFAYSPGGKVQKFKLQEQAKKIIGNV